jgi:hypothetical protein
VDGRGLDRNGSRHLPDVSWLRIEQTCPAQHPSQELQRLSRSGKFPDGTANDDHEVVAGTQLRVQFPQCLARDPLQPVALYGTAALATRDDPIAVAGRIGDVRQKANDQWTIGNSLPPRPRHAHVAAPPQPKSSFHVVRAVVTRSPCRGCQLAYQTGRGAKANHLAILRELVLFRNGERMASLAPSPGKHGAATAIGHAGQEAKFADALDPLGLIRTLRHS